MRHDWRTRWLACVLLLCCAHARAEDFHTNVRLEVPLVTSGAVAWIASEALKSKLAPDACRVCGTNAMDAAIRERVRWDNGRPAATASNALLFGVVPAAAFGGAALLAASSHVHGAIGTDLLMVFEAMVFTADLTQLTKLAVGRERPYAYAERRDHAGKTPGSDDELSFFSGHTSITFALAAAAGTTASLRGYRFAPLIWAIGMPLAALTGYFRLAADKHYFTDVLTGALVGSAVGVLVPWLHTRRFGEHGATMSMSPPGTLTFTWMR